MTDDLESNIVSNNKECLTKQIYKLYIFILIYKVDIQDRHICYD